MDPRCDQPATQRAPRWGVIGLVVLTLLVRGGTLALVPGALTSDPDGYRYLAQNLLDRGTFGYGEIPTAYRPPLYPLMLTVCVALGPWSRGAIALLHLVLGLATVWLVYRLGRRWGLGSYALLAAALVACDPILLVQSTLVMTETPAALLAVLSLIALTSASERPSTFWAMMAGGCLALATLCRATFLAWAVVAAVVLPTFARTWTERLKVFAAVVAAAAVVLGPWAVRNQVHFGRPIVATTHGGYTLLLGNNPSFYDYLRTGAWGTVWDADEFNRAWQARATRAASADEVRNDRLAYAEAWQNIRRQPGMFVYSCAVRAGRLWAPLAHQVDPREAPVKRWSRYLVALWYVLELALAAIGVAALYRWPRFGESWQARVPWPRLRGHGRSTEKHAPASVSMAPALWALLLAGCFTAVHALYWTNLRMRGPLMPAIALAAAAGMATILNTVSRMKG